MFKKQIILMLYITSINNNNSIIFMFSVSGPAPMNLLFVVKFSQQESKIFVFG